MENLKKDRLTAQDYITRLISGDTIILSKSITLIESNLPSDQELSEKVLEGIMHKTGNSIRIGITGIPGVGKSTFIESLGKIITANGLKLAVLAVDPSSKKSGGSIMGDKTRMEKLSVNPSAFIRPSPTGITTGGVADKTRESILLCEAAGYNVILIETVGVGQSELAVRGMVDFFLLLMISRSGDELQGMKRGIMEMADAVVITKSDGDNIESTNLTKAQFRSALHLFPLPESGWQAQVLTCSALQGLGLDEIWEMINEFKKLTSENSYWEKQRNNQRLDWFQDSIKSRLLQDFRKSPGTEKLIGTLESKIISGEIPPTRAAAMVVSEYLKKND